MKNYLDQLATELYLRIVVNGAVQYAGLHDSLMFNADANVIIDDIEILPKYKNHATNDVLSINEPFYCWYHRISGQGWLLTPH